MITVEHLGLEVVTVDEGADPEIGWVYVTELLDPARYLSGGELVLTNGLWRHRQADSRAFVEALVEGKAAAIGFGLHVAEGVVPKDLAVACEKAELPLVAVPFDVTFSAIGEAVAGHRSAQDQERLVRELRRSHRLLDAAAHGSGAAGILRVLHRELGFPLMLITRTGRILARHGQPPSAAALQTICDQGADCSGAVEVEVDGAGGMAVFPITTLNHHDGYLVCRAALGDLSEDQLSVVDQARAFLALELAHLVARQVAESRLVGELIEMLLGDRLREAQTRLRTFNLDLGGPLGVFVLAFPDAAAEERSATSLADHLRSRGVPGIAGWTDGVVVAIVGADDESELHVLARETMGSLTSEGLASKIAAGVGSVVRDIRELRTSVIEAIHAARVAGSHGDSSEVLSHRDVTGYRLLVELQTREVVRGFCDRLLGPIEVYDARAGSDLILSLRVFLECCGQWGEAAERLHVHPNSLRYRIHRVEELTGRSLRSMDDRVDFYIALRAGTDRE